MDFPKNMKQLLEMRKTELRHTAKRFSKRGLVISSEFVPKACYYNAQMLMVDNHDSDRFNVRYFEEYVIGTQGGDPTPHAWITVDDEIVDPFLDEFREYEYIDGQESSIEEVRRQWALARGTPIRQEFRFQ